MVLTMISDRNIHELISTRVRPLLATANHLCQKDSFDGTLTRPLLGMMIRQSTEMEELLDAYGAKSNKMWKPFRWLVATTKHFANVSYELLHILYALPNYRLLPIERDFAEATRETLAFTCRILVRTGARLVSEAGNLAIPIPAETIESETYTEILPPGRLPNNIEARKIDNVYETITLLATAFLNLVEESSILQDMTMPPDEECLSFTSDLIKEENIRRLNQQFHNLQSLYDTYVSETDVEVLDKDLVVLRGHISVVYHLLKVATSLTHYYERHVRKQPHNDSRTSDPLVDAGELLDVLINYSIAFAEIYIRCAQQLCLSRLKSYTEIDEIEVAAPVYRGFHVRPSTLIAGIVLHYGTGVEMIFQNQSCNAAVPLEIFRINEKINAEKRRLLTKQCSELELVSQNGNKKDMRQTVRNVISALAGHGSLVIYEHPLQLPEHLDPEEHVLIKHITNVISQLMAEGKIDIIVDIKIKFVGDKRVLNDIRLLAESGYGEDISGNNIPLPKSLLYLRQK